MDEASEGKKDQELRNLREELDHLRGHVSLLRDVSRRISSSLDLSTVLQEVVDAVCDLTGARYGALGVFDASGRIQQFVTHGITLEERERIGNLPQGLGILDWLYHSQQPLRLADLSQHPRSVGFPPHHPAMKAFLGAPISHGDESLGNLYLTEKADGMEFTPEDESLLVLFTAQAAAVIRNARLHRQVEMERQRLDAILNDSPNGMIYVDKLTGQLQANWRAQEMLECSFGPAEGLTPLEGKCCTPDGSLLPVEAHPLSRALRGEFIAEEEHLIIRSKGPRLPVLWSASPVRDGQGSVIGAVALFRDMSRVKEAQRRMEELAAERGTLLELAERERQRLQVLLDTSPVGIIVIEGHDRQAVLFNKELQHMTGLAVRPPEYLEQYESQITLRRPDGTIYRMEEHPLERALSRGETTRAEEMVFEIPDGRRVPVLMNATPVNSRSGEVVGAIAVIQDITPLEEMEKLRSEFLGIVSHDLKTPLTAIKGSAAIVLGSRRPFDAEETWELFEVINEQADRLRDLVDNILDMTRIEAGSLSISAEPTDLREVLAEAQATFARSSGSQEVQIEVANDLPPISADRRRVTQVLANLFSNAGKFSPAAAPITIKVEHDTVHVTVHVRDRGRGIPREKLPYLFKKFSQVHEDGGRKLSASGLGLAICKGIVEAHGGRIWADSLGEGQGTTFSFTLPVAAEAPDTSIPETARRAEHLGRVRRAGERTRILAVDDEPQTLRYLQRSLNGAGYEAIVTSDPSEVTKLVEVEEPDLVLLDLILPGTSGFEVLQRIREFSGVPVIFLSVRDESENAVRALEIGADDYITKPFSPSELLARIEAALRRRVLPDQMEMQPPFVLDDLTIDFPERRVAVGGQVISLSATEYKLLYELATHAGRVLTHDQILQCVWGPEYSGETELIRSFIRNLRRKLGDDARHPRYIFTEPQVGYRIPRP